MKVITVDTNNAGGLSFLGRAVFLGACLSLGVGSVQGQETEPPDRWGLSLGLQHYSEPEMQLQGPEVGLHWRSQTVGHMSLEADAVLGLQNYSSSGSGSADNVFNVDTRWRVLKPADSWPQWLYGLALHTHYNNLRGATNTGYAGYERISAQIWLLVRWTSEGGPQPWTLDAGLLLWGQHISRLSQVSRGSDDVKNIQRHGAYVQVSTTIDSAHGVFLPYARWTWVDDSNTRLVKVSGELRSVYEPRNNRVQLGVQRRFR